MSETDSSCRIDIWLWRARFLKTRSLAAALVERGAVRLTHQGRETRLDKPSRCVRPGDLLTFALQKAGLATREAAEGAGRLKKPAPSIP